MPPHRARAALAPLLLAAALAGCPPGTSPAPVTLTTDTLPIAFPLDVPRETVDYDRTWSLYLGEPVDTVRLRMSVAGLAGAPSGFLEVRSGDGTLRRTVTGNGGVLVTLAGNVVQLRLVLSGRRSAPPTITVDTLWVDRPSRYTRLPVELAAPANAVTAYPLTPHAPVDVHFAEGSPRNFFFSARGLSGPAVDVLLFGPGRVLVSSPESGGDWPRDTAGATWTVDHVDGTGTPGGFAFRRIALQGRTRLLFSVVPDTGAPTEGHARLVVLPVGAPGRLSFPSSTPSEFMATVIGIDYAAAAGANVADCTGYTGAPGLSRIPPLCYDGHEGLDWLLAGGQAAQASGVPVNTARAGIVLATDAAHADDCFWNPRTQQIQCVDSALPANFVAVRHDDGLFAYYFHLKTESVLVAPGTPVTCGQRLGAAGSSGISAMPHLHFELRALNLGTDGRLTSFLYPTVRGASSTFDPFQANTWREIRGGMPVFRCS